jgi:hypothetical protein
MSQHIKLIPNFCNIKPASQLATDEKTKDSKNKKGKNSKNSKANKKEINAQKLNTAQNLSMLSFRTMTLRMLNLTNMIHMAQVGHLSMLRKSYSPSMPYYSPQQHHSGQGEHLVTSDDECIEPILAKK